MYMHLSRIAYSSCSYITTTSFMWDAETSVDCAAYNGTGGTAFSRSTSEGKYITCLGGTRLLVDVTAKIDLLASTASDACMPYDCAQRCTFTACPAQRQQLLQSVRFTAAHTSSVHQAASPATAAGIALLALLLHCCCRALMSPGHVLQSAVYVLHQCMCCSSCCQLCSAAYLTRHAAAAGRLHSCRQPTPDTCIAASTVHSLLNTPKAAGAPALLLAAPCSQRNTHATAAAPALLPALPCAASSVTQQQLLQYLHGCRHCSAACPAHQQAVQHLNFC
jgi:hypothetical protein